MNKGVVGDHREGLSQRDDRSREPFRDPFSKALADRADARRAPDEATAPLEQRRTNDGASGMLIPEEAAPLFRDNSAPL
jgi:hypothetical protein